MAELVHGLTAVAHDYVFRIRNHVVPGPDPVTVNPNRLAANSTNYSRILELDGDSLFSLHEVAMNPAEPTQADCNFRWRDKGGGYLQSNFLPAGSIPFQDGSLGRSWSKARGMPVYPGLLYPPAGKIDQDFQVVGAAGGINRTYRGMKLFEPGRRLVYRGPELYREYEYSYSVEFTCFPFVVSGAFIDFFWLYNRAVQLDADADFVLQWISTPPAIPAEEGGTQPQELGIWLKDPYDVYFSNQPVDLFYFAGANGLPRVFWPEYTWPAGGTIRFDVQAWWPNMPILQSITFQLTFGGVKRYKVDPASAGSEQAGVRGYSRLSSTTTGAGGPGSPGANAPGGNGGPSGSGGGAGGAGGPGNAGTGGLW